jgi:hypothetical protein
MVIIWLITVRAQLTVINGIITFTTKVIYHYKPIEINVKGHNCREHIENF